MFTEEVKAALAENYKDRSTIILYGIESHICVLQTAIDAIKLGYKVVLISNGVSSQLEFDRSIAINQLNGANGLRLVSTEGLIFELLVDQKHPKFKKI